MRAVCRFGIAAFMAVAVACESNAPSDGIVSCDAVAAFKIDSTTGARLENTDCQINGYFTDLFAVTLAAQTGISILMQSDSFDTWLDLIRESGEFIAVNDDSVPETVTNSVIQAILPAGSYLIAPSSLLPGVRGPYSLSVLTSLEGLAACDTVWVTRGVVVQDSITANDCAQTDGSHADIVLLPLLQSSVVHLHQRSTAVNARLEILRYGDTTVTVLASNDDSAATTNDAYLAFTALGSALYIVRMGTAAAGQAGAYTLEIDTTRTAAGASAARMPTSAARRPTSTGVRSPRAPRTPKGLPPRVGPR